MIDPLDAAADRFLDEVLAGPADEDIPTPASCRHCPIPQATHGRQYTDAAGWHCWTPPTDRQRLDRMREQRNARKDTT
jgi:hypothetical protein